VNGEIEWIGLALADLDQAKQTRVLWLRLGWASHSVCGARENGFRLSIDLNLTF